MFEEEYFKNRNPGLEPKHEYIVRKWIQYFSLEPLDKILVHGCGFGQRLHWFMELGMSAWGFEISKYAIEHAYGKAYGRVFNFFLDGPFDLVISIDVLEHLTDIILNDSLFRLSRLSDKAVFGITYITSHNFPRDPTHINGKTKQQWKEILLKYYDKIYDAPSDWVESDMYLICYKVKK